jgi:hypothetical protein
MTTHIARIRTDKEHALTSEHSFSTQQVTPTRLRAESDPEVRHLRSHIPSGHLIGTLFLNGKKIRQKSTLPKNADCHRNSYIAKNET